MALDPYASCPCGSGKKFRWCCQDIYENIDKAFTLDSDGQHEAALRVMEGLVQTHPGNPEAWGRQAALFVAHGRVEDAERTLQKAFELNPDYPFGYLLRGQLREAEGEIAGAAVLYRKAAERYHPEAKHILAQVYLLLAECESKLNRPIAGRAALQIMLRLHPHEEAHKSFEEAFGDTSRFPLAARREYTFRKLPADAPATRRAAWDQALQGAQTGQLRDAVKAFEQLTTESPDEAAAWYNFGLVLAWQGENARSLEALDRYVALEKEEAPAAEAWAMAEVLRLGQGMEEHADYLQQTVSFQIRDPQTFFNFMNQWGNNERRLFGSMTDENQTMISGLVLEKVTALTPELAAARPPRIAAYYLIVSDLFQMRSVNVELLEPAVQELQQRVGAALSPPDSRRGPAGFADVHMGAVVIPINALSEEDAQRRVREHLEQYFEEVWIQRPLKSLGGISPLDAAGHASLRKKLAGIVQFQRDCMALGQDTGYDFDRLLRKLGLLDGAPAAAASEETAPALDIPAMSAGDLAGLGVDTLTDEQLEQAFQTAHRLDARELATRFGRQLISRPVPADRPDRFSTFSRLIENALRDRELDDALDYVNEGQKVDCEHNEGHRRNDYELRRGQVHAKRGEWPEARDVFQGLIERAPSEMRYRATATEAMLSGKQGAAAVAFAEQGLAEARKQQNRDSEQHFLELVAAAKKQTG